MDALKDIIAKRVLVKSGQGEGAVAVINGVSKRLDWIFDFRSVILSPDFIHHYTKLFWDQYQGRLPFQVAGLETSGIPLVTSIVMEGIRRGTPVNGFYLRKSRKREGLMKVVEGTPNDHPVVLIDDLINSGGSLNRQIKVLSDAGLVVSDIFALVAFRPTSAYEALTASGTRLNVLYSLEDFGLQPLTPSPDLPAQSPEVVWRYRHDKPSLEYVHPKSTPAVDDSRVYFGTDDGVFLALDKHDGKTAWSFRTKAHPERRGIVSSPVIYQDMIYFGSYDGNVYALDRMTGEMSWTYEDADWVGSSPVVDPVKGVLYIGLEFGLFKKRGGLVALDALTGKKLWSQTLPDLVHCTPLYVPENKMVIIGSNGGHCYAFDADSGRLRWQKSVTGEIKAGMAFDPVRELVVFGSFGSNLYALNVHDGETSFTYPVRGPIYSTPLIDDDIVYVTSTDKHLYAVDINTGQQRWSWATNGRIFSSPVKIGSSIWFGSNDGSLREVEAKTGLRKRTFQFSERIVNPICPDRQENVLFVATVANELYCVRI